MLEPQKFYIHKNFMTSCVRVNFCGRQYIEIIESFNCGVRVCVCGIRPEHTTFSVAGDSEPETADNTPTSLLLISLTTGCIQTSG